MRKRLIGKAFAVAMTGAMAFTATPVTANGLIVMLVLLGLSIGHMKMFIMRVMLLAQMF